MGNPSGKPFLGWLARGPRWRPAALLVLVLALVLSGTVYAVHDLGLVQLDGNAALDNPNPPYPPGGTDWAAMFDTAQAFQGKPLKNTPTGTVASVFVQDFLLNASGPDPSYHAPSNKDDEPINAAGGSSVWGCTTASNPTDKDDVLNAMALAVDKSITVGGVTRTHRLIYTGGDRFSNDGTAFLGAWFFQNNIRCNTTTGQFENADDPALPGKKDGDILVLVNFSKGGAPANITITAFAWHPDPVNPTTAEGFFTVVSSGARCLNASTGDQLCAEVNFGDLAASGGYNGNGTFTSPWPFQEKGTPNGTTNGTVQLAEFFESGIDLTAALNIPAGQPNPCFSSFMLETRSSDSLSATLKDFALGSFPTCGSVKAIKYHDLNASGTQDTGEPTLSGWRIFIDTNADKIWQATETSVVTDANGVADFGNQLQTGTYSFCEVLQTGWVNSDPVGGTLCKSVNVQGGSNTTIKFGNYQNVPKSGVKFHDLNANGVKDSGEPGLNGWEIRAYTDTNGNGVLDAGETSFVSTTTATVGGVDGSYSFSLKPGTYIVCEVLKTDWIQSFPTSGAACPGSTKGYAVTLVSGTPDTGNDFGNFQHGAIIIEKRSTKGLNPLVAKAGAKFSVQGPSPSTTTFNVIDNNTPSAGDKSDENSTIGRVCVSGLLPFNYTVNEVTPPAGYGPATQTNLTVVATPGTDCSTSLPTGTGVVAFFNAPLYDLQVNFRDAGSGETSATIVCTPVDPPDFTTPPANWTTSSTYTGRQAPATVTCIITVDP